MFYKRFLLLLPLCCFVSVYGQNLMKPISSWKVAGVPHVSLDSADGEPFLRIANSQPEDNSYYTYSILQQSDHTRTFHLTYETRGDVWKEAYSDVWVNIYEGKNILYTILLGCSPAEKWTSCSRMFAVPADATRIRVGMRLNGAGETLWRSFSLVEERHAVENSAQQLRVVEMVVDTLCRYSLHRDNIARDSILPVARELGRINIQDAVSYLLGKLQDKHGSVNWDTEVSFVTKHTQVLPSSKQLADGSIRYIGIPTLRVSNDEFYETYANSLYDIASSLEEERLVLDLRGNGGGVLWPMLSGISPLLPDGTQAYFSYVSGEKRPIQLLDGKAFSNDASFHKVKREKYLKKYRLQKVLVLVDGKTASSAEMLAAVLASYPTFKLLGEPTAGFLTGVSTYELDGGPKLRISTSRFLDRMGNEVGEKLQPTPFPKNKAVDIDQWDQADWDAIFDQYWSD